MSEMPAGWQPAKLGEVAETQLGRMLSNHRETGAHAGPYLRNRDVRWGQINVGSLPTMDFAPDVVDRYRLAVGDLLVCEGGEVGRAAIWTGQLGECYYQKALHRIRPSYLLSAAFLRYLLEHYSHTRAFERFTSGSTIAHLPQEDLRELPVPLPPRAEQDRIVAAIEEQFSRLDAGVAALERVRRNVKRMRAAVLGFAVMGQLVDQDSSDEPAIRIIERIANSSRVRSKRTPTWGAEGPMSRPGLPQAWEWATVGQLFDVYVGATPPRADPNLWNGCIPWVSSGEVAFGRIRDTREKITEQGLGNPRTRLHPAGTVMVAMIGEGKTRGQSAILDIAAAHNQNCASIRVSETEISPDYIYYVLMERYERTRSMASGGNQPALNGERVRMIPVPLPPLSEQHRIVREIQRYESAFDVLGAMLSATAARSDFLRFSILATAFFGQLVPQDPNDEQVSVLLDRIAAERASSNGLKPGLVRNRHTRVTA
jgi:type I restriction enzyme S subunit